MRKQQLLTETKQFQPALSQRQSYTGVQCNPREAISHSRSQENSPATPVYPRGFIFFFVTYPTLEAKNLYQNIVYYFRRSTLILAFIYV